MDGPLAFAIGIFAMLLGAFAATFLGGVEAAPALARTGEEGVRFGVLASFTLLAAVLVFRRRRLL